MTTADYTNDGNRLLHRERDTGIQIVRSSNHHWELHSRTPEDGFTVPAPLGAFGDYRRAFLAACAMDRAAVARSAAFDALHDLGTTA